MSDFDFDSGAPAYQRETDGLEISKEPANTLTRSANTTKLGPLRMRP